MECILNAAHIMACVLIRKMSLSRSDIKSKWVELLGFLSHFFYPSVSHSCVLKFLKLREFWIFFQDVLSYLSKKFSTTQPLSIVFKFPLLLLSSLLNNVFFFHILSLSVIPCLLIISLEKSTVFYPPPKSSHFDIFSKSVSKEKEFIIHLD